MRMSTSDNASIVQRYNDAYNQRDWDAAAAVAAPNATFLNVATGESFRGVDGAKQFLQVWATAFPESQVETTNIVADAQGAVIEFIGRGTQTGPLQTPAGPIPPTGRSIEHRFCSVNRIENGKITESRLYFDVIGLMQQLGVAPPN
jgi:steroid delta-isomerase-like uncharacterized protein